MLTTFAPRAFSETWFVLPGISHILQMTPEIATEFADAVHRVLRGYKVRSCVCMSECCCYSVAYVSPGEKNTHTL